MAMDMQTHSAISSPILTAQVQMHSQTTHFNGVTKTVTVLATTTK